MSIADKNCFAEKTGYNVREDMWRFIRCFDHPQVKSPTITPEDSKTKSRIIIAEIL